MMKAGPLGPAFGTFSVSMSCARPSSQASHVYRWMIRRPVSFGGGPLSAAVGVGELEQSDGKGPPVVAGPVAVAAGRVKRSPLRKNPYRRQPSQERESWQEERMPPSIGPLWLRDAGVGEGMPRELGARAGLALPQALHQPFLDGTDARLSAGHRAHLAEYVLDVLAGSAMADAQSKGDLLVGHARRNEIKHA